MSMSDATTTTPPAAPAPAPADATAQAAPAAPAPAKPKSSRTTAPVDPARIRQLLESNKKADALRLLDKWEAQWADLQAKRQKRKAETARKEPTAFNLFVKAQMGVLKAAHPEWTPNQRMSQCADLWRQQQQAQSSQTTVA
jgi:pyruvate/2-oxoglutarate dehydrogenase complex dihydrolipoamide acyltransferase (E2) component